MNVCPQTDIRATVNTQQFIQNIRTLFSGSNSYLGELLQNARRAGATLIEVSYGDNTLIVKDNGSGITDFSKLTTFCESGWDEAIRESDSPYGMGVFSYFFAGNQVTFESQGQRLVIDCEALLQGGVAHLEHSNYFDGTQVTIQGVKEVKQYDLTNLVSGFSVDVIFNGKTLERPNALNNQFVPTEVGFMRNTLTTGVTSKSIAMYLQGLPIGPKQDFLQSANFVLHLDSTAFEAVMPDRKSLYNQNDAMKVIDDAVKKDVKRQLELLKKELAPEVFAALYYNWISYYDFEKLLDDVEVLTINQAKSLTALKSDYSYVERYVRTKASLNEALLVKNMDEDIENSDKALLLHSIGLEYEVFSLNPNMPETNWAHRCAHDYDELNIELMPYECVNKGSAQCDVEVAKSVAIKVTGPNGFEKVFQIKEFALTFKNNQEANYFDMYDATVVIMEGCFASPHECISDYLNEREDYVDDWAEEARMEWIAELQRLNGKASFKDNLAQALRFNNSVVAQREGEIVAVVAGVKNSSHTFVALDESIFESVSSKIGCDPQALEKAFKTSLAETKEPISAPENAVDQ